MHHSRTENESHKRPCRPAGDELEVRRLTASIAEANREEAIPEMTAK
jgi:hypothetical protein